MCAAAEASTGVGPDDAKGNASLTAQLHEIAAMAELSQHWCVSVEEAGAEEAEKEMRADALFKSLSKDQKTALTTPGPRAFKSSSKTGVTCFTCGRPGHWSTTCPQAAATSRRKDDLFCTYCRKSGHLERYCYLKGRTYARRPRKRSRSRERERDRRKD